ncbi:hypothetical protein RUM44_001052 [Polyplax serrata]|uniref:Uncharacterized protein n=1 Tax=Polyplax serrata TaxID=468196 RepID=A0ABR1B6L1_POLSC
MAYDSTVWLVVIQLEELGLGASKTNLIRISLTNTQSIVKFNGQISEALNHIKGTTVSKKVKAVGIHKIQILERTERPCRSASDRGILLFLAKLSEERKPSLKSNEVFSREKNDFGV